MSEPVWLSPDLAVALHARLLAKFGGMPGVRDAGLLDSALARPRQLYAYTGSTVFELAAAYTAGIVRNHPFVDGNKRVGFMLAYVFLARNGWRLIASNATTTSAVLDLAAGVSTEKVFARWLSENVTPDVP